MARGGQGAALDRKKLLADPIMVTTIVVLIAFLTLFILYPLAILLVDSLYGSSGRFSFGTFRRVLAMPTFTKAITNTLKVGFVVGVLSTAVGLLFAYVEVYVRMRRFVGGLFKVVSMLPVVSPPFVLSLSMIMLFGRAGLITRFLLGIYDNNVYGYSYALLPHYNIFDNVAYGLKLRRLDKETIHKRVMDILALVGLEGMEGRMTNQLSGGQQQRVALARALVLEPGVLLFDEPLSNLDAKLRVTMRTEIRRIQQEAGITAVYVTHDQSEAMALSDRIIIMEKGVVSQMGTPQEIYYHPKNAFVADFIGDANFLKGRMVKHEGGDGVVSIDGTDTLVRVAGADNVADGAETTVVLRPESTALGDKGYFPVKVVVSSFMGAYQLYHVMLGDTKLIIHEYNPKDKKIYPMGDTAYIDFAPGDAHCI